MSVNASVVDPNARCSPSASIYRDGNGLRWAYMLNLTDINFGTYGNNKFYMGQLIQDRDQFVVFRRWGRVGDQKANVSVKRHGSSLESAMGEFSKVFASKSGNHWPLTAPFEKKKGKYMLIELDEEEGEALKVEVANQEEEEYQPCTLPTQVQDLLNLICDRQVVAREMKAMNIDLKRMPLGKLSKTQILRGYTILQQLATAIEEITERSAPVAAPPARGRGRGRKKAAGSAKAANAQALSALRASLRTLSSDFYTLIPHDVGRSLPPTIETMETVKEKLELLEVLQNLEISHQLEEAHKQQKENKKPHQLPPHPLVSRYEAIKAEMVPLDPRDSEYAVIQSFVASTCGSGRPPAIHSVLKVARPAEQGHLPTLQSVDNHRLLWHGSRLSNIVGILSQGLRIAPPEAPVNGYNFGKGLYFADALAKSSSYCYTSHVNPRAVLFLVEVALGKPYQTPHAEYLDYAKVKQQYGCDSTHGMGSIQPLPTAHQIMPDGVVVPVGPLQPVQSAGHFMYNEFIVYKTEQVRLRYVLTVDLH